VSSMLVLVARSVATILVAATTMFTIDKVSVVVPLLASVVGKSSGCCDKY